MPSNSIRNDLTGRVFGRLTVVRATDHRLPTKWLCVCTCGKSKTIASYSLSSGKTKSCGCLHREMQHSKYEDLKGREFGRLKVVGLYSQFPARWKCSCECGEIVNVLASSLKCRKTQSCGCWRREFLSSEHTTHGLTGTPEYQLWCAIKSRCYNRNNYSYPDYGGRGISVCLRWHSFANFYSDMCPRPSGMSIERIDNNGPYSPRNCKWATVAEQNKNRRSSRTLEAFGRKQLISEWAREIGISHACLTRSLKRWGSMEVVLGRRGLSNGL